MSELTFKFRITIVNGMRPTSFRIDDSQISKKELEDMKSPTESNVFEGEIIITPILRTVSVSLLGVGEPHLAGSFNLSYEGKKFFEEDQKFIVKTNRKFRFYKEKVKIPL
jgi:hypothetical protein